MSAKRLSVAFTNQRNQKRPDKVEGEPERPLVPVWTKTDFFSEDLFSAMKNSVTFLPTWGGVKQKGWVLHFHRKTVLYETTRLPAAGNGISLGRDNLRQEGF